MRALLFASSALLLPVAALAQTPAQPTGKLPDAATPIAYRLDFTILPEKDRFNGHTEIDIDLKAPARTIWMHGRDLHVAKTIARSGGKSVTATFTQKSATGLAQLDFGKTLPAGRVTLVFDYDAAFGTGTQGLYHVKVDDAWYSWTQFESIEARAAFPSFDQPGYKTPFTVSITTKPGFTAVSNAPEASSRKAGALVRHQFAPTKPLPTYLIALVTGPFATAATMIPPTPQRSTPMPLGVVGTKPNAGQMAFARDESGKIVSLLEKYFGQAFPFPKLDQIGSPIMPGAMENAGADIYGDGILFLDEKASSERKQAFGMVVAHELAHQWFGDLVTPAWWDDIWLNESFANWMGYRIGNEWRPGLQIELNAIEEGFDAMDLDALAAGRPIHQPIPNDGDIDAAFDQITYGKGGQVVAMIAAYMGDEAFREGVRLHMQRHAYGNASTDQFFTSLADAAHDPRVLASLKSFVDQQGVPLVTLHREGDALTATQSRYGFFGANLPAEQWIVPLCVRQGETKNCTLLDKPSMAVSAKGSGALVPNAGGWGYYRFELDPADWDALIAAAPTLPAAELLAVDDSVWASFYAGRSPIARPIALTRATATNASTKIVFDNAHRLRDLEKRGLITAQALPAYRKLFVDLYGPMLTKIGFDPTTDAYAKEEADQRELRKDLVGLVAVTGHDAALRAKLTTAFDAFVGGDDKALDPAWRGVAAGIALNERGVPFAQTLLAQSVGKPALFQALGQGVTASNNPDIARWFLNDFQDPRVDARQRLFTVAGFLRSPYTRDLASDFMIAHFDEFVKNGGGGGVFSGRAAQMFGALCSNAQADAVDAKLRPTTKGSTLNLDRAIETIRTCARFRDAKAGEVSAAIAAGK
ncbi:M1 family peptidase [Sphingomonas sp. ABOLD]|uniref:M1 family metallopeptidase n=1 Tax=Sphingomonas sp. ABOLD TaxID=1985877 RepID=UPI000F7E55DB|nr:M1 family metallopeptidase [Sphingomonas sp. ABOLD]RSV45946.1 M1 family peptidase [Sphingomonas sp. ABOLD]